MSIATTTAPALASCSNAEGVAYPDVAPDMTFEHVACTTAEHQPPRRHALHSRHTPGRIEERDRDGHAHPEGVHRSAALEQEPFIGPWVASSEASRACAMRDGNVHLPSRAASSMHDHRWHRATISVSADIDPVGRAGFEPATRGLKAPCSDQLSYRPREDSRDPKGNPWRRRPTQLCPRIGGGLREGRSATWGGASSSSDRGIDATVARAGFPQPIGTRHHATHRDRERQRHDQVGAGRGGRLTRRPDPGEHRARRLAGERLQDEPRRGVDLGRRHQTRRPRDGRGEPLPELRRQNGQNVTRIRPRTR